MATLPGVLVTAMACAAAVMAQVVAGKATRDALFLTSLGVTALPTMLVVTAACSVLLVALHARASGRIAPRALVPALFTGSGLLFVVEWLWRPAAPDAAAVAVYLHVSIGGPLLTSGIWLIASEAFHPRAARRNYGWIAAAGTLGGLGGALVAERTAEWSGAPAMLPLLGGFQMLTAWLAHRLARAGTAGSGAAAVTPLPEDGVTDTGPRSGARVIAAAPHLRLLVALLLLGTTSAALLDFVFKAGAVETYGPGDALLRFFALYYAATSLVSFGLQALASRPVLERFGLGLTTGAPSIALVAGSIGSLIAPGFGSLLVARGGESIFRTSWFRSGYELFFTPMPPEEKRAAKSLIDVGVERLGDALGGALVAAIRLLGPALPSSTIIWAAIVTSLGALAAASQLNRWYVRTLERSLVDQAGASPLSPTADDATARVLMRVRQDRHTTGATTRAATAAGDEPGGADDPTLADILALRLRRMDRIKRVLARDEGIRPELVAHVIPLLAYDAVADHAMFALRKVAEERAGELTDALIDANQEPVIRRRLAQVFSGCVSQRAADALMLALDDSRFDVRLQIARSLAAMRDRNPRLRFDGERVFEIVRREVAVGRPVWESRRLLDPAVTASPLDAFVRDRAGQSLAHVFTLLSLVLPREPMQIAFRSLQGDDPRLRGTALEYLESVLPPSVRGDVWPYLAAEPAMGLRGREQRIADLLRSSASCTVQGAAGHWERQAVAGFETV